MPTLTKLLRIFLPLVLILAVLAVWQWPRIDAAAGVVKSRASTPSTIDQRVLQYGDAVRARLAPLYAQASVTYPPARLTFIGLKEEKLLEVWAGNANGPMKLIKTYPVKAASGVAGPKLREGDRQVPEGVYKIESLNPNSRYHLSLRVNYPNAHDLARAREDGRSRLGGDIMIHGKALSIGCLAMGDEAAEDLFVTAALTGLSNITVLLCPVDLRNRNFTPPATAPAWTTQLYSALRTALAPYAPKK